MSKRKPAYWHDPPEVLELFQVIADLFPRAKGFDGTIVRSVGIKYSNRKDFFSGVGAAKSGGRWNRVGLEAIYASLDVMTATSEACQNFVEFGFPLTAMEPRVTAAASVSLAKVLDLTNAKILTKIGYTISELIAEDWKGIQAVGEESWTQAIGRGCMRAGFQAIIVPSARQPGGRNIVIYPKNLAKTDEIKIIAGEKLPK